MLEIIHLLSRQCNVPFTCNPGR